MMRFEYDPRFVEEAAFLAARRDPEKECALHERLDPLYGIADAEWRQRVFREAYGELFGRFGLDRIIPAHVRTFPLMTDRIDRCIVREAVHGRAQSVDLYGKKSDDREKGRRPTLIMALCPESFVDWERISPWLYRQLRHVEDMVDDGFAYDAQLPAASPMRRNLIRDRYSVLWDLFVEGRLIRSGVLDNNAVEKLWSSFLAAFTRDGRAPSRAIFERLLTDDGLTHPRLLTWATEPGRWLADEEGKSNDRDESEPAHAAA
jgi:hypothetical protein